MKNIKNNNICQNNKNKIYFKPINNNKKKN